MHPNPSHSPTPLLGSLRARLVASTGGLVLVGFLALTAVNVLSARSHALDSLAEQTRALAKSHAADIGNWVAHHHQVVASMAPAADAADPLPSLRQGETAGGFDTTYVAHPDKRIVFSKPQDLPAGYDPTARPWYQLAQGSATPVLTAPYLDAATKKPVVTFAHALRAGGQVAAVVAGDVFMDGVVRNVASIKPMPGTQAFIVARDGRILVHEDGARLLKPAAELSPALTTEALAGFAADDGALGDLDIDGRERLLRAQAVPGTDWLLVVALDRAEATAGITALLWKSLLASLAATAVVVLVVGAIVAAVLRRLTRLSDAMREVASGDGDLAKRLPTNGRDELASIAASFNAFVAKIEQVVRQIREAAESVRHASGEIASGNADLSARTERTAASLAVAASSMQQLTGTVHHSADAAREADELARSAAGVASRGGELVSRVVSTMDEINASSRKIADITGVIDGIAFQTNILALNAAVEAARAGEQGRGFAVVAAEVRSLAQRSAEAAKEIKSLIGSSVDRVESGAALVADAGRTMEEIVASVHRVSETIAGITTATSEQSAGIGEVGGAVGQLDQLTQQNAALVEQSAAAAESLKEQAQRLAAVVGTFRLA